MSQNDSPTPTETPETLNRESAVRNTIADVWKRARLNAFAHKLAAEHFTKKGRKFFIWEFLSAISGILFVILVYLINSSEGQAFEKIVAPYGFEKAHIALLFVISSIVSTLSALFLSVLQHVEKFGVNAAEHKFFCGSYQYIAQRARESNWPDKPYQEVVELLKDLERDFQLLKARGNEPSDYCFDKATTLFKKIRSDEETRSAQSYDS